MDWEASDIDFWTGNVFSKINCFRDDEIKYAENTGKSGKQIYTFNLLKMKWDILDAMWAVVSLHVVYNLSYTVIQYPVEMFILRNI